MAEGLFQIGVKGLITNEQGNILLLQNHKGYWDIPGGRIDEDETLVQTLVRELREEIGIELQSGIELFDTVISNITIPVNGAKYGLMLVIYKVDISESVKFLLGSEEAAFEWVSVETALDRLSNKYPVEFLHKLSTFDR